MHWLGWWKYIRVCSLCLWCLITCSVQAEERHQVSDTANKSAEEWIALSKKHFWDNAPLSKVYAQRAIDQARKTKNQAGQVRGLLALGQVMQFSDPAQANLYFKEARQHAEQLADPLLMAQAYEETANFYLKWEQYGFALQYAQRALNLITDHRLDIEKPYGLLGNVYARQGRTEDAIRSYERIIAERLAHKAEHTLPGILSDAGNAYFQAGQYSHAREYYLRGVAIGEKYQDERSLGYLKDNVGLSYYAEKNYEAALPWHKAGLAYRQKVGSELEIIAGLNNLAATYLAMGYADSALLTARQSYPIAQRFGQFNFLREVTDILSAAHYQLGHADSAYVLMRLSQEYLQAMRKQAHERAVLSATASLEAEQQRHQNQLLSGKNQTLWWSLLSLGLLILLLFTVGMLLLRQNRLNKRLIAELKEINATKDKLFAIVGHDLRSPVNSLVGLLHLLDDQQISPQDFMAFSQKLRHRVDHLHITLNNLLMWAFSQMQGIHTKPRPVYLAALTGEVAGLLSGLSTQKGVQVHVRIPATLTALADEDQIRLVLRNLLSNAVKFTPTGHSVFVDATQVGQYVECCVADEGTGIAPDIMKRLFGYEQSSSAGTAGEKGTGLGLILCKEFVEKNGGQIRAESQPGQGSKFYFTIPVWKG